MEKSGESLYVQWKSRENVLRLNGKVGRTSSCTMEKSGERLKGKMEKAGERLRVKWVSQFISSYFFCCLFMFCSKFSLLIPYFPLFDSRLPFPLHFNMKIPIL